MPRHDDRAIDQLRPVRIQRGFVKTAAASVMIEAGSTMVLCTASLERTLPPWRKPRKEGDVPLGWVTAEYNMLPGSTTPRKQRDRSKVDGRTTEIQRLIGRCLRAVVDFAALGEHTITIDCDVLQADGGTRTASITGGFIALADVVHQLGLPRPVLVDTVAAISVGVVNGEAVLDLDYREDSTAEVDMNVVMTGSGRFIEVQGTAEGAPFSEETLQQMLTVGKSGIRQLTALQHEALGDAWPGAARMSPS
ncbi:MAG: ribonuclease PH [Planctomycetaceae bacterium]|nr:ribonuclease PH [Planctomycetaceae bacterium]